MTTDKFKSALQVRPFIAEEPQPLLREIATGADFPIHALQELKDAVIAVQGLTLVPLTIPAASALTIASLAIQGFIDVETLGGIRPTSLYALTIAQSGERKSSSDALLMEAVRSFEREQSKEYQSELSSWQNTQAIRKGERENILAETKRTKGSKRTELRADLEALGPEPLAPPSPERTVTEPTYEGLTRKLSEGMPSLGIFSDEGGQFLGGYAMASDNRQKTMAALNDLWQGNPIRRTRQGDGSITLFGRRLAVHLMVQPSVARSFMSDAATSDIGFLPRFLISEPVSTIGLRLQSLVKRDMEPLDRFSARLSEILEKPLPMDEITRELKPRTLMLSPEARELLCSYSDEVEIEQRKDGKYASILGFASKSAEQACRIAGVLTGWADLNAASISGPTMANAITIARFYLDEALRLSNAAAISTEIERAETLRKWLIEVWPHAEILPSEVLQKAPIRALRESPAARAAISVLVRHGWLVPLPEQSEVRGRIRKEAYEIVRGSGPH